MALMSDSVMVIFCDVASDREDHDDWHSTEHMHERLSIPGFLRGTRWTRASGSPRYMIVYEVAGAEVAHSPEYLARLNDPTPWTTATMKRLRGMSRGFCTVVASAGYGLGGFAVAMRVDGKADSAVRRLSERQGIASAHLLVAVARPPMTKEQSIRGEDAPMTNLLLVTAHDKSALERIDADTAIYELAFTATAAEVRRTATVRRSPGCR